MNTSLVHAYRSAKDELARLEAMNRPAFQTVERLRDPICAVTEKMASLWSKMTEEGRLEADKGQAIYVPESIRDAIAMAIDYYVLDAEQFDRRYPDNRIGDSTPLPCWFSVMQNALEQEYGVGPDG